MKTRIYRSNCETVELTYKGNLLKRINVLHLSKSRFEELRKHFKEDRKELDLKYFYKVVRPHFLRNLWDRDINILRSLQFVVWVIVLGALSNFSLVLFMYDMTILAFVAVTLFTLGVSFLFFRYGNR